MLSLSALLLFNRCCVLLLLSVIKCVEFVRIWRTIQDFFLLLLKRTTRKSFNDDDMMMITIISLQRVLLLFLKQRFSLVRKRCFCLCRRP